MDKPANIARTKEKLQTSSPLHHALDQLAHTRYFSDFLKCVDRLSKMTFDGSDAIVEKSRTTALAEWKQEVTGRYDTLLAEAEDLEKHDPHFALQSLYYGYSHARGEIDSLMDALTAVRILGEPDLMHENALINFIQQYRADASGDYEPDTIRQLVMEDVETMRNMPVLLTPSGAVLESGSSGAIVDSGVTHITTAAIKDSVQLLQTSAPHAQPAEHGEGER